MAPYLHKGMVLSLESTTYPGTTEEELKPRIEKRGLRWAKTYFLVFSPEREDPGNPNFKTQSFPKFAAALHPRASRPALRSIDR